MKRFFNLSNYFYKLYSYPIAINGFWQYFNHVGQ